MISDTDSLGQIMQNPAISQMTQCSLSRFPGNKQIWNQRNFLNWPLIEFMRKWICRRRHMHDRVVTKLFKPSIWNPQTPFAETASSPGLHSFMATFFRFVIPKAEDDASTRLVLTSESFECGIGTLQTIQNNLRAWRSHSRML